MSMANWGSSVKVPEIRLQRGCVHGCSYRRGKGEADNFLQFSHGFHSFFFLFDSYRGASPYCRLNGAVGKFIWEYYTIRKNICVLFEEIRLFDVEI